MSLDDIYFAVLDFEEDKIGDMVRSELGFGTAPAEILNDGLVAALDEVGKCFTDGTMFVPDMLMAAETMKAGLEVLRPLLTGDSAVSKGTVVIGSVKGDMHDIGKNLVAMIVEGAGFRVIDLGVDVPKETFVYAAREHNADFVLMSALLTTTMIAMKASVDAIKTAGLTAKILVGGAPVNPDFAKAIGADGYANDAPGAAAALKAFAQGTNESSSRSPRVTS